MTSPSQADDTGSTVRGDRFCINAKVIVYAALSGMVSFLPDGTIYGCNHHFAVMLFGYSQEELLKKVNLDNAVRVVRVVGSSLFVW